MLTATHLPSLTQGSSKAILVDRLKDATTDHADTVAVVDGMTRLSYHELTSAAERFAVGLQARSVRPGDAVLIQLPNWWETVVAIWGTWMAGAVVLPVVPIYRVHELSFFIDQVHPAAVVAPDSYRGFSHAAELRNLLNSNGYNTPVVGVRMSAQTTGIDSFESILDTSNFDPPRHQQTLADDIALVLYTSGTTSSPKGALHSHRTLLAESASIRDLCRITDSDCIFMPSPLGHITGISYAIVLAADIGCPTVLLDRWDSKAAVDVIEREGCTFTVSATPFLRGLTDAYADRSLGRSCLTRFVCGGADIPSDLVKRAHQVMQTAVVRTYGSTEMPTLTAADPFGDLDAQAAHDGQILGKNEMCIQDNQDGNGELLVRGPELFLGYVDPGLNEAAFTPDGYFRTGDTATIDDDGTLRISGRIKDIINRGGEKYSAGEVERALLSHPAVRDVAIVGYPDEKLGERACAFVVASPNMKPTLAALREHLAKAGFAIQKSPERLEITNALPRTQSGKIQKFLLRAQLRADHHASADKKEPE